MYVGCSVDAYHDENFITRCSHSGILLFVKNYLIKSFRKYQNTSKLSMYVSELVEPSIAREMIVEIRIKLKMFRVPLYGRLNIFCDNNGLVNNTSIPESNLSKNNNVIN